MDRRIQRHLAAAEGIHSAGRVAGGFPCTRWQDGVPARGALGCCARARGQDQRGAAAVCEPAIRFAVRAGARVESRRWWLGRVVGPRTESLGQALAPEIAVTRVRAGFWLFFSTPM